MHPGVIQEVSVQNFKVEGMKCGHCVRAVTEAVMSVDASAKVEVDRATGRVSVDSLVASDLIARAIVAEGYMAELAAG